MRKLIKILAQNKRLRKTRIERYTATETLFLVRVSFLWEFSTTLTGVGVGILEKTEKISIKPLTT